MKRFIIKFFVLLIWVAGMIALALHTPTTTLVKNSLLMAQIQKDSLMKNTPSPRIIFVGGSSISFGLDSKMIKDSLHLNPVNTGVEATLGLKYMLRNALRYIKPGDIIVVCAEYNQFYNKFMDGQYELLPIIFEVSPDTKNLLDARQYCSLLTYAPSYIASKLNPLSYWVRFDNNATNVYGNKAFNAYGDVYLHWTQPSEQVSPYGAITGNLDKDTFTELRQFEAELKQRNARLLISFPPYQQRAYDNSPNQIALIAQKLKDNHFELLGSPQSYLFPDSMLFNTSYHLNRQGVTRWTNQTISNLKKALR
ncbi:hypothetical protein ABZR88_17815 [Mucilaginibacter yixingensis]|uniref:hypothetical protein n=1 Tax=Mucilaginibacter yixingensis TaxID=1295612 RepID=UPI000D2FB58B|nr:hypothetical protein [Mucilaginibacter yixingensis]